MRLRKEIKAHDASVSWIELSPDGSCLLSTGWDGKVKFWSVNSFTPIAPEQQLQDSIKQASFSPDGQYLLVLRSANADTVQLFRIEDRSTAPRLVQLDTAEHSHVANACFSVSSDTIVTCSDRSGVKIWELVDGRMLTQVADLPLSSPEVFGVALSGEGDRLATVGDRIELWDTRTWARHSTVAENTSCRAVRFCADDRYLVTSGFDPISIWDVDSGRIVKTIPSNETSVLEVSKLSPTDSPILAAVSRDVVRTWRLNSLDNEAEPHVPTWGFVQFCSSSSTTGELDSVIVAVSPRDLDVQDPRPSLDLINIANGVRETLESERQYLGLAVCPSDPHLFAVGGRSERSTPAIDLWDARAKSKVWSPPVGVNGSISSIAFSHRGKRLAIAGAGPRKLKEPVIEIWDVNQRQRVDRLSGFFAVSLAFSHDDRYLIAVGGGWNQGVCRIFDLASNVPPVNLPLHQSMGMSVTVSPDDDGRLIAAGDGAGSFRVWRLRDKETVLDRMRLTGHALRPSFLGDDRSLAVCIGRELVFWRLDAGERVGSLPLSRRAQGLTISPSGQTLAAVSWDGRVMFWHRDGRYEEVRPVAPTQPP